MANIHLCDCIKCVPDSSDEICLRCVDEQYKFLIEKIDDCSDEFSDDWLCDDDGDVDSLINFD